MYAQNAPLKMLNDHHLQSIRGSNALVKCVHLVRRRKKKKKKTHKS